MTILTNTNTKTHYEPTTQTMSRAVLPNIAKINLGGKLPTTYPQDKLELLNNLANLDDENFKALSDFQRITSD